MAGDDRCAVPARVTAARCRFDTPFWGMEFTRGPLQVDDGRSWKAVCAEPGPDALFALSASAAIDALPSNLLNLLVSRILTASRRQTGLEMQAVDLAKDSLRVWHLLT